MNGLLPYKSCNLKTPSTSSLVVVGAELHWELNCSLLSLYTALSEVFGSQQQICAGNRLPFSQASTGSCDATYRWRWELASRPVRLSVEQSQAQASGQELHSFFLLVPVNDFYSTVLKRRQPS